MLYITNNHTLKPFSGFEAGPFLNAIIKHNTQVLQSNCTKKLKQRQLFNKKQWSDKHTSCNVSEPTVWCPAFILDNEKPL